MLSRISQLFLHGNIDNDGSMSGRINQGWNANNVTKAQAQVCLLTPECSYVMLRCYASFATYPVSPSD